MMRFSHFIGITTNAAFNQPLSITKMYLMSFTRSHLVLYQKPLTARAGLQRPYNNQILSEETIFQFCSKTIENISFNLI